MAEEPLKETASLFPPEEYDGEFNDDPDFDFERKEEELEREFDESDDVAPFEEVDLLPIIPAAAEFGGTFKMRDYQREGVDGFYREIQVYRSTMIVWATGLGKTIAVAEIAALWPRSSGRILFLAHRRGLVQQAAKKISTHICEDVETEMGSQS